MCGRYRLSRRKEILEEYFDTDSPEEQWNPRYNIAPTQRIPVIRQNPRESVRELSLIRWGLIPSWAKDPSIATKGLSLGPVGGVSTSSSCPALSRMTAIHAPTCAAREQKEMDYSRPRQAARVGDEGAVAHLLCRTIPKAEPLCVSALGFSTGFSYSLTTFRFCAKSS